MTYFNHTYQRNPIVQLIVCSILESPKTVLPICEQNFGNVFERNSRFSHKPNKIMTSVLPSCLKNRQVNKESLSHILPHNHHVYSTQATQLWSWNTGSLAAGSVVIAPTFVPWQSAFSVVYLSPFPDDRLHCWCYCSFLAQASSSSTHLSRESDHVFSGLAPLATLFLVKVVPCGHTESPMESYSFRGALVSPVSQDNVVQLQILVNTWIWMEGLPQADETGAWDSGLYLSFGAIAAPSVQKSGNKFTSRQHIMYDTIQKSVLYQSMPQIHQNYFTS